MTALSEIEDTRAAFRWRRNLDLAFLLFIHLCAFATLRLRVGFRKWLEHGTMVAMDSERSAPRRPDKLIVIALLAVALVWRLVYFLEMEASPYGGTLTLDSQVYHELALEAADGQWSHGETFFQAPLYPWVLGVVYSVFGPGQTAAKLLQILLSIAGCWLIYRLADRTFGRTVAQVALAMSAIYGMSIYFTNELLVVTLIVFLDLLGLDLLLSAQAGGPRLKWAASGLAFGLSAIARPTILPFVAVAGVWIVAGGWRSDRAKKAVVDAALFGIGAAFAVLPVAVHNLVSDGNLILVSANGGVNFFIGNNPQSDGVTAAVPGTRPDRRGAQADQMRIAREALNDPDATPGEISDYWFGRAWQHIRTDPGGAFRHTAYKAFILWNAYEISNNRVIEFVTRHSVLFARATLGFWVVLPLSVAGLLIGGGVRDQKVLLLIFVVTYGATVVPFFINARFRMPLIGVLIIFAAAAISTLISNIRSRVLDRRVAVAVTAAVVTAVVIRPLPTLQTADAQAYFNEAEAYRQHQDYANAAHWYERALVKFPAYCDAAYNLARIHTEIDPDVERVIEVLEGVAEPCATDFELQQLLQRALCAVGRCGEIGGENPSEAGQDRSSSDP
jgi:4-amino-4-deoxy-L-arabinose transferase-like glycosyltransferase